MKIIPCEKNQALQDQIETYAEELKIEAHKIGSHGLSEPEFYNSGLFRGAIERIRGQFSATMGPKREFAKHILNYMEDNKFIRGWSSAGEANRHDYAVVLNSGRTAVIELKGCLDGNNTTIFERPPQAQEFVLWSICTNPGADPRHNAWSGIHTRLGAEIVARQQRVDGVIIWDMVCGTVGRPCPKLMADPSRVTAVGPYNLPPACIYTFPGTVPSARSNPHPSAQSIQGVEILKAFHDCFHGKDEEVNYVAFEVKYRGTDTVRRTTVTRDSVIQAQSSVIAIRRS